ncbi:hypothetical protein LIER_29499 [Lithospermum erythrorhizon]|uniref:Uncharacterized protein n=1 Tax=Lithospermum erythrorhizon TaxID=34254 RepID=A0AAV3RPJ4_LITER
MSGHIPLPLPAAPAISSYQQPLRLVSPLFLFCFFICLDCFFPERCYRRLRAQDLSRPVVASSSSEEDEVTGPLMRGYLSLPGFSFFVDPFIASLLTYAASFKPRLSTVGASVTIYSVALVTGPTIHCLLPLPGGFSVSKKSSADPSHEKLISSFSTLGDKWVLLPGDQLEKARDERDLQRHLKNLTVEYSTLQERYATNIRRTEAVKAKLEGVQAERDSTQMERKALKKENESLRASRDEAL